MVPQTGRHRQTDGHIQAGERIDKREYVTGRLRIQKIRSSLRIWWYPFTTQFISLAATLLFFSFYFFILSSSLFVNLSLSLRPFSTKYMYMYNTGASKPKRGVVSKAREKESSRHPRLNLRFPNYGSHLSLFSSTHQRNVHFLSHIWYLQLFTNSIGQWNPYMIHIHFTQIRIHLRNRAAPIIQYKLIRNK